MAKYPFTSKLMFAIVMHDTEACRRFIEKLFPEKKVKEIRFRERNGSLAEVEKTIIMGLENKSVRLDVLFEGDDTIYDIELQIQKEEDLPKRSRYYHMAMGRNALRMGESYGNLKASYVIFICCYDAFGIDEPVYRFEMFDENLQLKLGDGSSTIILNTKCSEEKIPEELKAFYEFVNTGRVDSRDKLVSYLDKRVEEANENEEVDRIMTLEEELIIRYNNGLKKGREEGITQGAAQEKHEIAKAMKEKQINSDIISEVTGLTIEEIKNL